MCFVCKLAAERRRNKLTQVPFNASLHAYIEHGIFIPEGSRLCASHLNDQGLIKNSAMMDLPIVSEFVKINSENVNRLIDGLRDKALKNFYGDFEQLDNLDSANVLRLTGLDKDEIIYVSIHLVNVLYSIMPGVGERIALRWVVFILGSSSAF
jgi:hypothetical protein